MLPLHLFVGCTVIISLANCASLFQDDPVVQTKSGPVKGTQLLTKERQRPLYAFRGIPYAEPPVGALRFEPPVAKKSWTDVIDAAKDKPGCIQGSDPVVGSEDCLHINVYTPTLPADNCQLLPVLVWIYGGGFDGGDASYELYGPDHLSEKDVVVVSFNYRLGLFGFMSTGDLVVPGNNGLKDQVLALKWVQDNVNKFCGNPNQVTIGGQSAGSASVAYHIQSPKSKGLFQQAILSSGVSLSLWAYSRNVPAIAATVAGNLRLDSSSSQSIINGLRTLNATYLQSQAAGTISSAYLANNPRFGFAVGPVSEPDHPDAFFTGKSHQLLKDGQFNKVPILIGFNSMEGIYDLELLFRLFLVQFDLHPEMLLPDMNVASNKVSTAASVLKSHYFGWLPISLSNVEVLRFLSHDQFVRSIREFARLVQKHASVYFYRFSYEGGLWGYHNRTTAGVTHSEELGYYWVSKYEPLRPHDLVVRDRMVTLLTNFIKHGDPTPNTDALLQNAKWQTIGTLLNYLDIGESLVLQQSPESVDMTFWDDFYTQFGQPPYALY